MPLRHPLRLLGRGRLVAPLAGLLLAALLSSCSAFGDVGDPTDAHLAIPPGNQVSQPNSALSLRVLPKPPANPEYTVIIYHNVNTVGEFVPAFTPLKKGRKGVADSAGLVRRV